MYNQLVSWAVVCGDASARSRSLYHGNRILLCNWLFRGNTMNHICYKDGSVATSARSGSKSVKSHSILNFYLLSQCMMALLDDLDALCKDQSDKVFEPGVARRV